MFQELEDRFEPQINWVALYAVNPIKAELRKRSGSLLVVHTRRLAPCRYNSKEKQGSRRRVALAEASVDRSSCVLVDLLLSNTSK